MFVGILALLFVLSAPAHSERMANRHPIPPPIPIPTLTIPGPIRTIIQKVPSPVPVPGPTKTIRVPVPGPTKTVYRPGPTQTVVITKTVPGPTKTVTKTVPSPSPSPVYQTKIDKKIIHDLQTKYRTREVTIGLLAFLAGLLASVVGMIFVYYVAYHKAEDKNKSFLETLIGDLRKE